MPPVPPAGALVGRDSEMALLRSLGKKVARGHGGAVGLIEGEPGMGKASLLRAAVAEARGGSCEVSWGSALDRGGAPPVLPFLEALRRREPATNPRRTTIVGL